MNKLTLESDVIIDNRDFLEGHMLAERQADIAAIQELLNSKGYTEGEKHSLLQIAVKEQRKEMGKSSTLDKRLKREDWAKLLTAALTYTDSTASDIFKALANQTMRSEDWASITKNRYLYDHEKTLITGLMGELESSLPLLRVVKLTKQYDLQAALRAKKPLGVINILQKQLEAAMEISELRIKNAELMEENAELKEKLAAPVDWKAMATEMRANGDSFKVIATATGKGTATIQRFFAKEHK